MERVKKMVLISTETLENISYIRIRHHSLAVRYCIYEPMEDPRDEGPEGKLGERGIVVRGEEGSQ